MSLIHTNVGGRLWLCLSVLTSSACLSQIPQITRIPLARGPVIGVSFDSPHDRLYVEQAVETYNAPTIELQRKILTFSLSDLKRLGERVVDSRSGRTIFPPACDAVATDASGSSITICLDDRISVFSTSDFTPMRSFRLPDGLVARGMALDEKRSEILVLLGPGNEMPLQAIREVSLAVYDWRTGEKKSANTIATVDLVSTSMMAFDRESGSIAVGVITNGRDGRVTNLFSCDYKDKNVCVEKATVGSIGSMSIFGSRVLLAPNVKFGQQGCIPEVNLQTGALTQRYCGAHHAIKEAVGVAAGGYALAFTGTLRYNPFTENTINIQSSLSLWSGGEINRPMTIQYPINKGFGQSSVKIVGDPATAEFATFTSDDNGLLAIVKLQGVPKASSVR